MRRGVYSDAANPSGFTPAPTMAPVAAPAVTAGGVSWEAIEAGESSRARQEIGDPVHAFAGEALQRLAVDIRPGFGGIARHLLRAGDALRAPLRGVEDVPDIGERGLAVLCGARGHIALEAKARRLGVVHHHDLVIGGGLGERGVQGARDLGRGTLDGFDRDGDPGRHARRHRGLESCLLASGKPERRDQCRDRQHVR